MTISISSRDQIIIKAHADGLLMKDIAPLVNMTTKGVISACRRLGLEKRPRSKYSDDYVDAIINAYHETKSYKEVQKRFPELATNKIAGIIYRAGACDARPGRKPKLTKPKIKNRRLTEPKFRAEPFKERPAEVVPLHIPFMERASNQCAYLYGDDPRAMTCCGHEAYSTTSWCLAHASIVFRPAEARERAPRPR